MARKVFFSFDYDDIWAVNVVRNHFVTKGGYLAAGYIDKADFEEIKRKGDDAIKRWIDKQMEDTSVTVVLIGENTYKSKWVQYEIQKSLERKNGLLGIYIHEIRDPNQPAKEKGLNPFVSFYSTYPQLKVRTYNWISDDGYNNFSTWVEEAAKKVGR
ncbi:MAG: TIR domain-containing protein [Candidatus Aenigmatarchaeota archaeon]